MNPAHYSYSWAASVVNRLYGKYVRATETVLEMLDISPRDLAKYLAEADPIFPQLRELIHQVDEWQKRLPGGVLGDSNILLIRDYLHRKGRERLVSRLDEIRKRNENKRAGFKGREWEGAARSLPSFEHFPPEEQVCSQPSTRKPYPASELLPARTKGSRIGLWGC